MFAGGPGLLHHVGLCQLEALRRNTVRYSSDLRSNEHIAFVNIMMLNNAGCKTLADEVKYW